MRAGWTRPRGRGCVELAGPDAVRFLNGQVTNQVGGDLSSRMVPACLCSLKGRVEALVWVTSGGKDALLIETEAGQTQAVFDRLDRYLIADDCELRMIGAKEEFLHLISADPPAGGRECWRYGVRGYDFPEGTTFPGVDEIPESELRRLKICHGIPEAGFEITGEEFPSELGLDGWAVDFRKGCYLGQEVISRIESVGKTKNRLRLFSTEEGFEAGHTFSDARGKEAGRVVRDSFPDGDGFLTSVFGRTDFEHPGFEEVEMVFPERW